jgi:aminoglycoside phosphotransferase (APT) family kinase protein
MAEEWQADLELSPEQASGLIARRFPELAPVRLELLGSGWDNTAYRVNETLVFRFPRRTWAAQLLENEARIMPQLAPHLPLPVTAPSCVAPADAEYPFLFAGYPLIPGVTACRTEWSDANRAALAKPLAAFLRRLHTIPITEEDLKRGPIDPFQKANLPKRLGYARERLAGLTERGGPLPMPEVVAAMERLQYTPGLSGPLCWVHGDFYLRHLIVDANRRLAGVIDWGDVCLADPALDLSIVFSFLPPESRPVFEAAYGEIDADTWERARFRALFYGAVLTHYGVETGDEPIRHAGEFALRNALP